MCKTYESVIIFNPCKDKKEIKLLIDDYYCFFKKNSKILRYEFWGIKELAYPIKKYNNGYFYIIEYKTNPESLLIIEKKMKYDNNVLRYIIVKLDKYAIEYYEKQKEKK